MTVRGLALSSILLVTAFGSACAHRSVHLIPDQGNADSHTAHLTDNLSSGLTGAPPIPADIHDQAQVTSAETKLDSRSALYLLDQDSRASAGGLRAVSEFDIDRPTIRWAFLPYNQADGGPADTVALNPWGKVVRTIRNYDHGVCYARLGWASLADSVAQALRDSIAAPCKNSYRPHFSFTVNTGSGPSLLTPEPTSMQADVYPVADQSLSDKMFWDLAVKGTINEELLGVCSVTLNVDLRARLIHSLIIVSNDPVPGAWRAKVPKVSVQTGRDVNSADPDDDSKNLLDPIKSDFAKGFASAINARMVIPAATNLIPWSQGNKISDINDLATCTQDSDCRGGNGPEDGACFKPDSGKGLDLSPDLVTDRVNTDLQSSGKGACLIAHLEPRRVNITPEGLELILIDDTNDKQLGQVQGLAAIRASGPLICGKPAQNVNADSWTFRVGDLVTGKASATFNQ